MQAISGLVQIWYLFLNFLAMKQRSTRVLICFCSLWCIGLLWWVHVYYTKTVSAYFKPSHLLCATAPDVHTTWMLPDIRSIVRNYVHKQISKRTLHLQTALSWAVPWDVFDSTLSGTTVAFSPLEITLTRQQNSSSWTFTTLVASWIRTLSSLESDQYAQQEWEWISWGSSLHNSWSFSLWISVFFSGTTSSLRIDSLTLSSSWLRFPLIAKWYTLLRVRQNRRVAFPQHYIPDSLQKIITIYSSDASRCNTTVFSSVSQQLQHTDISPSVTQLEGTLFSKPVLYFSGVREASVPRRYPAAKIHWTLTSPLGLIFSADSFLTYAKATPVPDTAYSLRFEDILTTIYGSWNTSWTGHSPTTWSRED